MINRKQKKWLKNNNFWHSGDIYYKTWNFINDGSILLTISEKNLKAQIMGAGELQPVHYNEANQLKEDWEKLNRESI
jgi:hypothetical protein